MTDDRAGIIRLAEGYMGCQLISEEDGVLSFGNAELRRHLCWPRHLTGGMPWNPFESIANAFALEAAIPEDKRREYVDALLASLDDPSLFVMIHATPRQRSEAALAVLEGK